MKKKILKIIIDYCIIILGDGILAVAVSMLLVPNKLSTGGFSGLATILNCYVELNVGTWIIILNLVLIAISIYLFGYRFVIRTIFSIIMFGLFINLFSRLQPITKDLLLASTCGGVLTGIGISINIRVRSTTGGSELLAKISNYYFRKIEITQVILIIDVIIVLLFVITFKNIDLGLYSIIAIYISTKTIEIILEGINYSTLVNIISDKSDMISDAIIQKIKRGVTVLDGEGFYTKEKRKMIYCAVGKYEIQDIKDIVKKIDKKAFIIITKAKEVLGEGFK